MPRATGRDRLQLTARAVRSAHPPASAPGASAAGRCPTWRMWRAGVSSKT